LLLRAAGIRTILIVRRELAALLSSCNLFDAVLPAASALGAGIDAWFPLLALPGALGTGPGSVPHRHGYLRADPSRVASWASRLMARPGLRAGVAWQGNPRTEIGFLAGRSMPAEQLRPLTLLESITLFSLQQGHGAEQLAQAQWRERIRCPGPFADFSDTAAVMAQLDLVITTDTVIAHLAGALGRPVWICLQKYPDWRWAGAAYATPWYASARLFRQQRQGDWHGVLAEIQRELDRMDRGAIAATGPTAVTPSS
jgi:hypothetical protein